MWPWRKKEAGKCSGICKELRFLKAEVNVLHGRIKLLESALLRQERALKDDWK